MSSPSDPGQQDAAAPKKPEWHDYQERVAAHFRSLGLSAETNVTLHGVRTSHDIDVVVRSEHVGFNLLWLIECKKWGRPVSKLHVLALREIVADLGADRGVLMAESGFQQGSLEAATLTNVQLTSLRDLIQTSSEAVGMAELRELQVRVDNCRDRYWDLSNAIREEYDLHPPAPQRGYSGGVVMQAVNHVLGEAFRRVFPIQYHPTYSALESHGGRRWAIDEPDAFTANTPHELAEFLQVIVEDLERRISVAEDSTDDSPSATPDDEAE